MSERGREKERRGGVERRRREGKNCREGGKKGEKKKRGGREGRRKRGKQIGRKEWRG